MSANPELEALITRYLDGSASKSETTSLAGLLAGDPGAAASFAHACRTEHALAGHFESEASAVATRRELADTIARSEERESAVAKTVAKKARGEAAVFRFHGAMKPALRAAAVLVLLAVAAYALWPEAKAPAIANGNTGEESSTAPKRKIIPSGQPVRSNGTLAQADSVKRKLTDFYLPTASIEGDNIESALDVLLEQYQSVASSHGASAVPAASIRIADGVNRTTPVNLNLDSSIPVSTALTSIALQSGARVRYTADGAVIEPYSVDNPDEIVTREFHVSQPAFQWMSTGASTTWSEPEEGISWNAASIMGVHGVPLDSEHERASYVATEEKLHVTATRDNVSRIDALRSAVSPAGKNQILVTSKIVTLPLHSKLTMTPLGSESMDLEAHLPRPEQTDRLITDPQFQVLIRAANQMKGTDILTMPSIASRSGDDIEISISPESEMQDYIHIPGEMGISNDQIQINTVFIPAETGEFTETWEQQTTMIGELEVVAEGLEQIRTGLLTANGSVDSMTRKVLVTREYVYPSEENATQAKSAEAAEKSVAVIDKNGKPGVFDAATGEPLEQPTEVNDPRAEMMDEIDFLWEMSDVMDWEQVALQLKVMESEEARLTASLGSRHPNVVMTRKKNQFLKERLMKKIHGSFDHAAAVVQQQSCTDCHTSSSEEFGILDPAMQEHYSSFQQIQSRTPTLNLTAKFEGHRIRVSGEVRESGIKTQSMDGAQQPMTIDLNLTPEVVEFGGFINYEPDEDKVPFLTDLPMIGRLFSPNDSDNVVEFDAVLGSGEHLMLEVSRNETTRTIVFLEAKKVKSR